MWEWSRVLPRAHSDTSGRRFMSTNDRSETSPEVPPAVDLGAASGKALTPEARRALEGAAQRRQTIDAKAAALVTNKEHNGRGGLEPVRYDDWEIKGIAADF